MMIGDQDWFVIVIILGDYEQNVLWLLIMMIES